MHIKVDLAAVKVLPGTLATRQPGLVVAVVKVEATWESLRGDSPVCL